MTLEILSAKTFVKLGLVLVCIFQAMGVYAASSCTVSATGINFGSYSVFSLVPTDSTGTISVTCTAPWPVVAISVGPSSGSGVFNPRRMRSSGSDTLNYNLFTDSSMIVIWGDGTGGTQTVVHQPNKKTIPETIFGRIFPGQDIATGTYSDSLVVTIVW